jgi:hypothetical protein
MQGLASVFIALSLLLSPLTGDHPGAGSSSGLSARQDQSGGSGPAVVTIDNNGGEMVAEQAMTIRDTDNSNCPYKYPNLNSKDYCECVVGRSDNFVCNVRPISPLYPAPVTLSWVQVLTLWGGVWDHSTTARALLAERCASRRAAVRSLPHHLALPPVTDKSVWT